MIIRIQVPLPSQSFPSLHKVGAIHPLGSLIGSSIGDIVEVLSDCFDAICLDDAYLTDEELGNASRVASEDDSPKKNQPEYINQHRQIFPKIIGYHQKLGGHFFQN